MASRLITDLKDVCARPCSKHLDGMRAEKIIYIVTCTKRSGEEQDSLYHQGRKLVNGIWTKIGKIVTNAKAGESAHNYGLAYDIAIIIDGKLNWNADHKIWQRAIEIGKDCGLHNLYPMESAHFELPDWHKYK